MSVLADRLPTELFMFKNFEVPGMHESYYSTDERFQPVPRPKGNTFILIIKLFLRNPAYFNLFHASENLEFKCSWITFCGDAWYKAAKEFS